MKHPLSKRFGFTGNLAWRKIWSLDRVECERHIRVLVIDEGTEYPLGQLWCSSASFFRARLNSSGAASWAVGSFRLHIIHGSPGRGKGLYPTESRHSWLRLFSGLATR